MIQCIVSRDVISMVTYPSSKNSNLAISIVTDMTTLAKSYLDEFNPKEYLDVFYASPEGNSNEKGQFEFYGKQLYGFYTKYSSKWNNKTARLLEFSGGPIVENLISAVPYVNQITFSAYLESERKEIELWKHGKEGAHDWGPNFKRTLNEVEDIAGDDAWREREEQLRKSISDIIPCDIFRDYPLLSKQEPYEIVITSLCLEVVCKTYAEFKHSVKKLVGLLKPGGFLLMFMEERETFYVMGKKRWDVLYLTLEQVKEALAEAGTAILVAERDPAPMDQIQNPIVSDYKAVIFVVAQKVEF